MTPEEYGKQFLEKFTAQSCIYSVAIAMEDWVVKAIAQAESAALERAAKVAEEFGWKVDDETGLDNYSGHDVAAAIRALGEEK